MLQYKFKTDYVLVCQVIGVTAALAILLGILFGGGIALFHKTADRQFSQRAVSAVVDGHDRKWAEAYQKNAIHMCGGHRCNEYRRIEN